MKLTLDAIGYWVKDIKTMVAFYRDVVGFDIEWDGGNFAGAKTKRGVFFNLCQRSDDSLTLVPLTYPEGINGSVQISCGVDHPEDVDKEYQRLVEAGATPIYPPTTEDYGMRVCFVADPEGNQIEICANIAD